MEGFTPISEYSGSSFGNFLIEVIFIHHASAVKAIEQGITHSDQQFKAVPSKDDLASNKLTHVNMTMLHIFDKATFVEDLMRSLRYYGKGYQIKQYFC